MPERLWKRCMEFAVKNSVGKLEKHFIDPRIGTAHKVGIVLIYFESYDTIRLIVADTVPSAVTSATPTTKTTTTTTNGNNNHISDSNAQRSRKTATRNSKTTITNKI